MQNPNCIGKRGLGVLTCVQDAGHHCKNRREIGRKEQGRQKTGAQGARTKRIEYSVCIK